MKREELKIAVESDTNPSGWEWLPLERFNPALHVVHPFFDSPKPHLAVTDYTPGDTMRLSSLEQ